MPLHDVLQRMAFSLLEVVAPVKRVEPGVEEELGPVTLADKERALREALGVLG